MKYSRHQGQGGKAKEDPHPQRNKNCLLNNRTEGATFVRFGAHNFRLTPVIAPVFLLPAGGKIKKTAGAGGGLWVRSGEEFGRCVLVFYVFRLLICKQRAKKTLGTAQ